MSKKIEEDYKTGNQEESTGPPKDIKKQSVKFVSCTPVPPPKSNASSCAQEEKRIAGGELQQKICAKSQLPLKDTEDSEPAKHGEPSQEPGLAAAKDSLKLKHPSLIDAESQSLPTTEILKPAKIETATTSQLETKDKAGAVPKLHAAAEPKKKPLSDTAKDKSVKVPIEEEPQDRAPELYMCSKLTGQKRTGWI
ncbi:hypothetical protein HUJ04_010186 [Dendroctonus ponderosae]|uniref:Uncharacterized protein n=2 Tax=Dendroctonus ponderosae TaxID=77166 RepID=A0AAR5NYL4_DENPD|nr:hypothetical protein HUJ04_010185 [Dendroctonus ponderosae]KAH1020548.1 hypothetical protein HUJ04_010186 [Dendroctonus ponderosae]